MVRTTALITTLVAWACPLAAQETVEERSSKVPFPVELTTPGAHLTHRLVGMGVRTRTILKVKVYAFGIYVDLATARSALSEYAGKTDKDLEKDKAFHARVLEMDIPMTLRLVMTRDVDGEAMADAFDGALSPRVERAAAEKDMPGGAEALETFRGYFGLDKVTKESELIFTCTPDGRLATSIRGELQQEIISRALCWALFDVYLGEKPISGGGKKNVMRGFAELLKP